MSHATQPKPLVVLLHYHLRPGGVTRVMEQQAQALDELGYPWLGLVGDNPSGTPGFLTINRLNYDVYLSSQLLEEEKRFHRLSEDIHQVISTWLIEQGCLGKCPVIIHAHNVTLEKNSALLPALDHLQKMGYRFLLQLHDFAEDGRPQVYSPEDYPQNCHFSVINSRDFRALMQAGLSTQGLHRLPNQVSPLPQLDQASEIRSPRGSISQTTLGKSRLLLYPVRAIRRKNIGEAILLSRLVSDAAVAVTLPPNNPKDTEAYEFWQDLIKQTNSPVLLGAGKSWEFTQLVNQADCFITTSVQEGFGFTFLEPWTIGTPVGGRYLEMVCPDFELRGISLDHLYKEIKVPLDWFDRNRVANLWINENTKRIQAFYQVVAQNPEKQKNTLEALQTLINDLPDRWNRLVKGQTIDFAILPRKEQAEIITRLSPDNLTDIQTIHSLNPALNKWPLAKDAQTLRAPDQDKASPASIASVIRSNTRVVAQGYGSEAYKTRLAEIYSQVLDEVPQHRISKTSLLLSFLNPEGIYLSAL